MKKNILLLAIVLSTMTLFAQKTIKKAVAYSTAIDTKLRLSPTDTMSFKTMNQPLETQICVFVDANKKFQSHVGIGAALTDASAETFAKLPKEKQKEFLEAHFDAQKGIGYTIARTNINSCDFSSDMYTYTEDKDESLRTFNIKHDQNYKIPFIKQAMTSANGKLKVYASPWSPPAWMKSNNDMLHGGKLLPSYYGTWAKYFTKFIKSYEKEGIPIWGITIQNEPMATQR